MKQEDEAIRLLRDQRAMDAELRAARIVDAVRALDVEDLTVDTMVRFIKRFDGERDYTFIALKVESSKGNEYWYITGVAGPKTNEEFEELLAEKGGFDNFSVLESTKS